MLPSMLQAMKSIKQRNRKLSVQVERRMSGVMESFIPVNKQNPFPIQNIPFGVISHPKLKGSQIAVAIGEHVVNVHQLVTKGFLDNFTSNTRNTLLSHNLNSFFTLPQQERNNVRLYIQQLLLKGSQLEKHTSVLMEREEVEMEMPVQVGDYTDFYASRHHAENVGEMFRGADNKLMPNWLHMPIAYHGRASSVNIQSTVIRPMGQVDYSCFGQENKLDIELEMGMILGGATNPLGHRVDMQQAGERVAGFCLMNDLSARMIQRIEYVPLGPFLGKNFSTVISPWVVFPEAIQCFQQHRPNQQDTLADYLKASDNCLKFYDIPLEVHLQPSGESSSYLISKSNMNNLHWSFEQMITHHASSGCSLQAGDLLGSGTISGEDKHSSTGSMLELSWNATRPIQCGPVHRHFLQDGDTVTLKGGHLIPGTDQFIGFGEVKTTVLPAHK